MPLNNSLSADDTSLDVFEGMTAISALIKSISNGTSDRTIIRIMYAEPTTNKKQRELSFLKKMADVMSFELIEADRSQLDDIASGTTHGGFIALCTKRCFPSLSDVELFPEDNSLFVLMEGIEDPYNFGYSVRSLYSLGADGIILPPRNWLELSGTVARSSAGCSELAPIYISEPEDAVKYFRERGCSVICAGIRDSIPVQEYDFKKPTLLIVGGEKRGISRKLTDMCDKTIRIEYGREFMGSLPTVSAVSVIAYEAFRQKRPHDFV